MFRSIGELDGHVALSDCSRWRQVLLTSLKGTVMLPTAPFAAENLNVRKRYALAATPAQLLVLGPLIVLQD